MFEANLGRYSFIGLEPFGIFTAVGQRAAWNGLALEPAPQEALRDLLGRFSFTPDPALPPFQGGLIALFLTNSAGNLTA